MRPDDDRVKAPSATSRRTASRAGVIETPKLLASPRRVSACPGGNSPCITCTRKARYSRSCSASVESGGRVWIGMGAAKHRTAAPVNPRRAGLTDEPNRTGPERRPMGQADDRGALCRT